MQLKRNWTQRYHWYPKPLAIRQQKTRLVHKHQPGTPPLLPLSGGSKPDARGFLDILTRQE